MECNFFYMGAPTTLVCIRDIFLNRFFKSILCMLLLTFQNLFATAEADLRPLRPLEVAWLQLLTTSEKDWPRPVVDFYLDMKYHSLFPPVGANDFGFEPGHFYQLVRTRVMSKIFLLLLLELMFPNCLHDY